MEPKAKSPELLEAKSANDSPVLFPNPNEIVLLSTGKRKREFNISFNKHQSFIEGPMTVRVEPSLVLRGLGLGMKHLSYGYFSEKNYKSQPILSLFSISKGTSII